MTIESKEAEYESIFVGADAVHPEDNEADVILPGEPGYQPPDETGAGASERGQGEQGVSADAAAGADDAQTSAQEGQGQEADQEEPPALNQQKMIPKARLDKELRARRALEARIKELEQSAPAPVLEQTAAEPAVQVAEVDVAELERAFLEGDMAGFGQSLQSLFKSRDNQMRELIRAELQKEVPGHLQHNQQRQSFEAVRDELESQYDFLDPNSEHFDSALVDTISNFTSSYVNRGYTPGDALQEAAEKVLRVEKPDLFKEQASDKQDQIRKERMNIDKKLQAANNQPPVVQSGEADNVDPLPDFENMSEAEFDRLDDKQLNDYLARSRARR